MFKRIWNEFSYKWEIINNETEEIVATDEGTTIQTGPETVRRFITKTIPQPYNDHLRGLQWSKGNKKSRLYTLKLSIKFIRKVRSKMLEYAAH